MKGAYSKDLQELMDAKLKKVKASYWLYPLILL